MLKIKELLQVLIETQKQINKSIKELNENITEEKQKLNTAFCTLNELNTAIETNIYTKKETIEIINREYDYRQKIKECEDNNKDLLEMIAKYCKYNDKYEVLELFSKINNEYIVEKIEEEK